MGEIAHLATDAIMCSVIMSPTSLLGYLSNLPNRGSKMILPSLLAGAALLYFHKKIYPLVDPQSQTGACLEMLTVTSCLALNGLIFGGLIKGIIEAPISLFTSILQQVENKITRRCCCGTYNR